MEIDPKTIHPRSKTYDSKNYRMVANHIASAACSKKELRTEPDHISMGAASSSSGQARKDIVQLEHEKHAPSAAQNTKSA